MGEHELRGQLACTVPESGWGAVAQKGDPEEEDMVDLLKHCWRQHAVAVTALAVVLGLTACARTEIIPTARNQAVVSTNAAPVCGTDGALRVANQMAAVATLRQGYERFYLSAVGTDSNVQVHQVPGSTSYTTGTVNVVGDTAYGNFQTYTPPTTVVSGRNYAQMQVSMLNRGDRGYQNALDAKQVLGPDWREKVANGIRTCR